MPTRERVQLSLLALLNFTHVVDFVVMMPLGPKLMRTFGITPTEFALLVSVYTFAAGVSAFLGAVCLDRFERRRALLLVYLGFLFGTLACGLAPSYGALLLARGITGLFGGCLSALVLAIVGDVVPAERRGRGIGIVMTAFSMATVVGVPVSLWLVEKFDAWHAPFRFIVACGIPVAAMVTRFLPVLRAHLDVTDREPPWRELSAVLGGARERLALLVATATIFGNFTIIPFISTYVVVNAGLPESMLPWIYLFGGTATFFTSPYVGRLCDRFGAARVFLVVAPVAILPAFLITHLPPVSGGTVVLVTTIFFIFNHARFVPATTLVTLNVKPTHRGAFMSLNSCLQQLSSGVASLLGGMLVTQSADGRLVGFGRLAWISALAIVGSLLLVRRLNRYPDEKALAAVGAGLAEVD
jgi:predicted MFS family arabinose efflux permease